MRQHFDILGWLYIAMGALGIFAAFFVFAVVGGAGLLTRDAGAAALVAGIGFFIAIFVAVLSLPNIICGWGLLKRKSWSRVFALVLGCLHLISFPFGTAIGIYSLFVLTQPEAQRILSD
jgi:hypothetical protein